MIDAVITWVDGNDPSHLAKRLHHQRHPGVHPDASRSTRFCSSGEIRFAVISILRFCPFVDRIHIVTDSQYPRVLEGIISSPLYRDRVRIVDHRALYGEHIDLLPVFSSRSIETMMHRVPELAAKFIYMNDDIFVGRPLEETHFFEGDRAVLRGRTRRLPNQALSKIKGWIRRDRPSYISAQQAAAREAGSTSEYFLVEHQPHPMHRDSLAKFYEKNPAALRRQAGHRFRSSEQISPIGLSNHIEIASGAITTVPVDVGYIRPGRPKSRDLKAVMDALSSGQYASFCVQSLDEMPEADRSVVMEGLEAYYAKPFRS